MEPLQIAQKMQDAIHALGVEGKKSPGFIEAKAKALSDYDRELAVAVVKLKADGTAVSIIDRLAKGQVEKFLYAKIFAEEMLKAHYARQEQLKSQLNGLQSMNRHLDSV